MASKSTLKQERIIEGVRRDLEGDQAIDFVRQSGYAIASAGFTRLLNQLGGREHVRERVQEGKSNLEILAECFPDADLSGLPLPEPVQEELFVDLTANKGTDWPPPGNGPLYDTVKLTLNLPSDVYEALRLAARGEHKSQNQLIVEILTTALSQMRPPINEEG
ncbi:MAG: hypothetical protein R6W89_06755 [Candidatus Hydrogenedentota bacterium]